MFLSKNNRTLWGIPYQGSKTKVIERIARFFLLKEFSHRSTFSSGGLKSIPVVEKLYGNKLAYDIIQKARS